MKKVLNIKKISMIVFTICCFFAICSNVYAVSDCEKIGGIKEYIVGAFKFLRFIVPALIIILSAIDFIGVVASGEDEKLGKAKKHFVIRLIVGIAIILLPFILEFILKIAGILDTDESLSDSICNVIN